MAFDWIHKHLYWSGIDRIYVAPVSNMSIVRSFPTDFEPASFVLDPIRGIVYWSILNGFFSDSQVRPNGSAAIWSAWMDGSHKSIIANNTKDMPMSWPQSLTIDFNEKKLYWVDIQVASIERCNLDGTEREVILKPTSAWTVPTLRPYSMAFHNEYIYWSDRASQNIKRFHISNRSVVFE